VNPPPTADGPTARHRALAHLSRVQILELLQEAADGLDVTALARRTGLHPNTIRVHLEKLAAAGLVTAEIVRRGGRGRPSTRYRATEDPDEDGYRLLASMLATALDTGDHAGPSPAVETAGRRWGQRLAQTSGAREATEQRRSAPQAVTALFDQLGFAPARDGDRIVLHACPYRTLARQHPDVICGLHLGMLRGALEVHGASGQRAWLEPFVTPARCLAGLSPAATQLETEERP
jgi:predicted ArsR family transcriptional regulator